jgi:DNA ligase-associated metallophosphoesterase
MTRSDCGGLYMAVANAMTLLRPSGALWLQSARALIVADLHFEKGSFYAAKHGQMLPPYDTAETLSRLEAEIEALAPAVVVCLGDSFHDAGGEARLSRDDARRIAALGSARTLVWITGNHDHEVPFSLAGETVDEVSLGGLILRHEPLPGAQDGEAAGHLHPCAKVSHRGVTVRRRCFVTDGTRIVLPAFGAFTGGLNVRDVAYTALFSTPPIAAALGRDAVHAVGWKSLRPD